MSGNIPAINPTVIIQTITTSPASPDSGGIPPALANVAPGTLLEGFVVNRTTQQQPILRTSLGDILVQSEFFLKTGSEVVIRVEPNTAGRARIISIDGVEPQIYAQQLAARTTTGDTVLANSLFGEETPVAQPNTPRAQPTIEAVLLKAAPASTPSASPANAATAAPQSYTLPDGNVVQPTPAAIATLQQRAAAQPSIQLRVLSTTLPTNPSGIALVAPSSAQVAAPVATPVATAIAAPLPNTPLPQNAQVSATAQAPKVATTIAIPRATVNVVPAPFVNAPPVAPTTQPQAPTPLPVTVANTFSPASQPASTAAVSNAAPIAASALNLPDTAPTPTQPAPVPSQNLATRSVQLLVPSAQLTPSVLANAVPAVVIGHEQDGAVIVQSPIGQLKLFTPKPLPTGAELLFTIDEHAPATLPRNVPLLPTRLAELAPLLNDWETLETAAAQLTQLAPQEAHAFLARVTAQPDAKLTTSMLFFLSALKGGDIRQFIGKHALELLEKNAPETAKKLLLEFAQLQNLAREPIMQNWSMYVLPLQHDREFEQVRLYVRHEEDEGAQKAGGGGQRFILEVALSQLGDMQLDGFIRKTDSSKQFDLILRTTRPWAPEMGQSIRNIFEGALAATGMRGMLQTQVGEQFFVRPLMEAQAPTDATGTSHTGLLA